MKNNYKYIFNQEPPNTNSIAEHMDFEALHGKFEGSKPKRKGRLSKILPWIGIAAAATVAFFMTTFGIPKSGANSDNIDFFAEQEYITPPVTQNILQKYESAIVDAHKGGTVKIKSTVFHIPPRAFVDRAGNLISGEIEIKLKEYHDYIDFFVSGIPMEYDSLGTSYQLESAGMIEVYAEQDGERIEMAMGKSMDVVLESEISVRKNAAKPPAFNIYRLDKENRNWVYDAVDQLTFADEVFAEASPEVDLKTAYNTKLKSLELEFKEAKEKVENEIPNPLRPVKPKKADSKSFTFELDIDDLNIDSSRSQEHKAVVQSEQSIRELKKKYANAVWEVIPGQEVWKPSIAQTEWDDYNLQPLGQYDFLVTFIKDDNSVDVKVRPVLLGEDYEQAIQSFKSEFALYESNLAKRNLELENRINNLEEAKAIKERTAKLELEEKISELRKAGRNDLANDELVKRKIVNQFSISSFGTWNCDRPFPLYVSKLNATFKDQHKTPYKGQIAYLVDKNRNTVFRFYTGTNTELNYDVNSDNLMWFLTAENKLAVYRPEDFKSIKKKEGKHDFVMDLVDDLIDGEDDLRRILDFK